MSENDTRSSFSHGRGFVIAASASAIGLGNLWRFPYEVSHYGGGIFVLIYLVLALTFGVCMMMMETAFGRRTGKSSINAFAEASRKHRFIGYPMAIAPIIVMCYYCVIGGWVLKWLFESVTGNLSTLSADGGSYWSDYIIGLTAGGFDQPMIWFLIFMAICMLCVVSGVKNGIEKSSEALMPALFIMMVGLIVYELATVDGIMDGISYYLSPDISKISTDTFMGAASQVFFSLSIAMGVLITYGSYTRKDIDLEKSAGNVCLVDSSAALLSGLMIVPVAFVFGFPDSSGMGLMFVALPQMFAMMPGGEILAPIFYLLVAFAAVTSAISMAEVGVSVLYDKAKMDRKKSVALLTVIVLIVGTVCTLGFNGGPLGFDNAVSSGMGWVGFLDNLVNCFIVPIAAILMCLFFGYVIKTSYLEEEIELSSQFRSKRIFRAMIMYIAPILLGIILISGLIGLFA